jgi:hypothetical protein
MPLCGCWELLLHHPWGFPPRTMPSLKYEPGHNILVIRLLRGHAKYSALDVLFHVAAPLRRNVLKAL